MRKLRFLITLFIIFWGLNSNAESYQRWITFVNEPGHIMTADEMGDIVWSLGKGEISSGKTYRLSTGVTYKIPRPKIFYDYIFMCVRQGESDVVTLNDLVRKIKSGDVVIWGNDISCRVQNYYYSSLHGKVKYIDDYSGAESSEQVYVLLINGKPKIKMDCGNPLWNKILFIPPAPIERRTTTDTGFNRELSSDWRSYRAPMKDQSVVVTTVPPEQPAWQYEPPVKKRKKFFRRTGVVIGEVFIGVAGVGGILYAILHKGPSSNHGTMSDGRSDGTTDTGTGSGGGSGGRGD